jgi:hypothetical protein
VKSIHALCRTGRHSSFNSSWAAAGDVGGSVVAGSVAGFPSSDGAVEVEAGERVAVAGGPVVLVDSGRSDRPLQENSKVAAIEREIVRVFMAPPCGEGESHSDCTVEASDETAHERFVLFG